MPLLSVLLNSYGVAASQDSSQQSRVGAGKGVEDVLARLAEELDEVGQGFLRLLAVVQWPLVGVAPETWGGHGEGEAVVLWLERVEPDLLDGAKVDPLQDKFLQSLFANDCHQLLPAVLLKKLHSCSQHLHAGLDDASFLLHVLPQVLTLVDLEEQSLLQSYIKPLKDFEVHDSMDRLEVRRALSSRQAVPSDKGFDKLIDVQAIVDKLEQGVKALHIQTKRGHSKGLALGSPLVAALEVTTLKVELVVG